jgi:demethylspheroidene O-methyltransferase
MTAAIAIRLLERRRDGRVGLGMLGAALNGAPGVKAMMHHNQVLYRDLADPVALLKGETRPTELSRYWPYAADHARRGAITPDEIAAYTDLMAESQGFVADDILDCDGSSDATGKSLGTDLIGGTATLPLLYAARHDDAIADALRTQPPADEVLPLLQRVAATGALDEARETARELVREAEETLDRIQGDLDTAPLRMVVRGVVDRDT